VKNNLSKKKVIKKSSLLERGEKIYQVNREAWQGRGGGGGAGVLDSCEQGEKSTRGGPIKKTEWGLGGLSKKNSCDKNTRKSVSISLKPKFAIGKGQTKHNITSNAGGK